MLNMTAEALKEALSAPFADADIEWRVGATTKDKTRGLAVPYVTNRAIQNRLDNTLGVDGWYNDYKPWPNDTQSKKSAQICGITIYFPEKDLWLTKWDGAENSDIEAVKGGLSDSMKRAAVQWGIGRYLYGMPQVWVGLNDRGVILDEDRPKLDQAHAAWVRRIKGRQQTDSQAAPKQPQTGKAQQPSGPATAPQGAPPPQTAAQPQPYTAPASSAPVTPPAPPQGEPPVQQQGQQPAAAEPVYYQVTGSVLKPAMNGGQNTSLMLRTADGATIQAFRAGVAPELTPGVWLANVVLSQKNQHGIVFYTLDSYELYSGQQAAKIPPAVRRHPPPGPYKMKGRSFGMEQLTKFRVTALTLEGFKCFADPIKFEFGNLTSITGHNAQGKSSIADAIAFAITGVPFFGGTRIDRLYHGEGKYLRIRLELIDGEGKPHVLDRRRSDDRMEIAYDGVMTTQNNLTMLFGERDVFLSIFNPLYFIQVLGRDGRNLLERYLPAIPHEQIMEALSEPVRAQLADVSFLSAEAYLKEVRAEVKKLERDCTYLEGQCDLLKSQADGGRMTLLAKQNERQALTGRIAALETKRRTGFDGGNLQEKLADLYARYEELQREAAAPLPASTLDSAIQEAAQALERRRAETYQPKYAEPIAQAQAQINALRTELARHTRILQGLAPGVQCPMCKQVVTEETLPAVKKEFEQSAAAIRHKGREKTAQLTELQELEQKTRETFEQFQRDDLAKLEAQLIGLKTQKEQEGALSAKEAAERQAQITQLQGQIQSMELDLETGMLTGDELAELARAKEQEPVLSAEIAALSAQVEAADADDKGAVLKEMQAKIKDKANLVSNLMLYISKRMELVLANLSMNKVAIQLYDVVKATGEVKDTFKFTYDGRTYTELSTSEQVKAGLEVSQLIMRLTDRTYPVYIDNGESVPVIDNIRPAGQVLLSQVVKGAPLEVRSLDAPAVGKAA